MRYVLAGSAVLIGLVLVGLAYHNTAAQAWAVLARPAETGAAQGEQPGPHE